MSLRFVAAALLSLSSVAAAQSTAPPSAAAQQQQASAKIVNGPVVEHVGTDYAIIAWSTNVSAGSVVRYGTDPNQLTASAMMPWGGITHRVKLKNLTPGQTYYYVAESSDAQGSGLDLKSTVLKFQTPQSSAQAAQPVAGQNTNPAAAQAAPAFRIEKGPSVESCTENSAVITWATTSPASSTVRYGVDPNALDKTAEQPYSQDGTHRVTVAGLEPGKKYFFRVESGNAKGSGASAKSEVLSFNTSSRDAAQLR